MEYEFAGGGRRLLATVLDFYIVCFFMLMVAFVSDVTFFKEAVSDELRLCFFWWLFLVAYSAIFERIWGRTLGKMLLRLRVIEFDDSRLNLNCGQTFRRAAVKWTMLMGPFLVVLMTDLEQTVYQPVDGEGIEMVEEKQQTSTSETAKVIGGLIVCVLIYFCFGGVSRSMNWGCGGYTIALQRRM